MKRLLLILAVRKFFEQDYNGCYTSLMHEAQNHRLENSPIAY